MSVKSQKTVVNPDCYIYIWEDLKNGDAGSWAYIPDWTDRTVHVYGTGTVAIEGSNEITPQHPSILSDNQGVRISLKDGVRKINECTTNMRPVVVAGDDESTNTCVLLVRRN